jgi:hypothetical protein
MKQKLKRYAGTASSRMIPKVGSLDVGLFTGIALADWFVQVLLALERV